MMPRRVDLPQPEGPRIGHELLGLHGEGDLLERDQLLAAPVAIGLGQPVHDDAHPETRHSISARHAPCLATASRRLSSPGTRRDMS